MQVSKLFVVTTTEYRKFRDVFNEARADTLPAHQLYDLKIEFKEGATPPFSLIYSPSLYKLQTLCEFIDEHLAYGFIHPTYSPCGAQSYSLRRKLAPFDFVFISGPLTKL